MHQRRIPIPQPRRLAAMPPDMIGEAIERLIDALDARHGDPDLEDLGLEDDFTAHPADGPGCPVSDIPEFAYTEWQSRGRRKEADVSRLPGTYGDHEDAEDDDPQGEGSGLGCEGEPDFKRRPQSSLRGPGCVISDSDHGVDDQPHDGCTEDGD